MEIRDRENAQQRGYSSCIPNTWQSILQPANPPHASKYRDHLKNLRAFVQLYVGLNGRPLCTQVRSANFTLHDLLCAGSKQS
jgi:hypothetical protein